MISINAIPLPTGNFAQDFRLDQAGNCFGGGRFGGLQKLHGQREGNHGMHRETIEQANGGNRASGD